MYAGISMKIIMIAVGIVLMTISLSSLAKREMTISFCLAWGLIAIIIIVSAFILNPTEVERFISPIGLILVLMIGFCVLYALYYTCYSLSKVTRRNLELSMQVSLLNQEIEQLNNKLEGLEANNEKNPVCNEHDGAGRS